MLIRSTPYACFVILRNGLTLEVSFDEPRSVARASDTALQLSAADRVSSQGVWMFREEVLFEVRVGQA